MDKRIILAIIVLLLILHRIFLNSLIRKYNEKMRENAKYFSSDDNDLGFSPRQKLKQSWVMSGRKRQLDIVEADLDSSEDEVDETLCNWEEELEDLSIEEQEMILNKVLGEDNE